MCYGHCCLQPADIAQRNTSIYNTLIKRKIEAHKLETVISKRVEKKSVFNVGLFLVEPNCM